MADYIPVVDTAHLQIEGRQDGQMTLNNLYFFASGGVDVTGLSGLAINLAAWVNDELAPLLSQDWSALRVRATDLTTQNGPSVEFFATATGGEASEAAPNNVAACVSFRTAQRGRSARGRNFVAGVPNNKITLNTLDSTWRTDLITAYATLAGAGSFFLGYELCVVSRYSGGLPRAAGLAIPVTSVTMVGNSVRSMRSREIGHGA